LRGQDIERIPTSRRIVAVTFDAGANAEAVPSILSTLAAEQVPGTFFLTGDFARRFPAGAGARPLFRFPFGDRDARTISAVNELGYLPVRWTVDTLGWQGTSGGRSTAEVTRRVLDTAGPGQIVLMHVGSHPTDGSTLDADALPAVIAGLRQRGYQFVTLNALLTG
jgi:peptidoglycan/xylan/chitin deacetylase (PgdA/CDA1 family)